VIEKHGDRQASDNNSKPTNDVPITSTHQSTTSNPRTTLRIAGRVSCDMGVFRFSLGNGEVRDRRARPGEMKLDGLANP